MIQQAMILAAGRGERMRPLTDQTPKPMLPVAGKPLIAWHLERLKSAGIKDVVINTSWLAGQIHAALGDGSQFGLSIRFSDEQPVPLETLGGILRALPLLGNDPFVLINADIWCAHPLAEFIQRPLPDNAAAILLTDNPPHHPTGDFAVVNGLCLKPETGEQTYTYTGIGLYQASFFHGKPGSDQPQPLAPWLYQQAASNRLLGQVSRHQWQDIGTPERLQVLADSLDG